MRVSKIEGVVGLSVGTLLVLGSYSAGDPWVLIPCLGLSWIALVCLCLAHEGKRLVKVGVAAGITAIFVWVGYRSIFAVEEEITLYPWITMTISVDRVMPTPGDDYPDKVTVAIPYTNRGQAVAKDPTFILKHGADSHVVQGEGDLLAPNEERTLTMTYQKEAVPVFLKQYHEEKVPIYCEVTYSDLGGRSYGLRYAWTGTGTERNPIPRVEMKGHYLKIKRLSK
jgi:hypothetical protein